MPKTAIMVLFLLLAGCDSAPAPIRSDAQPFSVISEQADPVARNLTLVIRVSGPATQSNVKSVVESIFTKRKGDFRHILVKSYTEGMAERDTPFGISLLEGDTVTHRFNSTAETQRIPTH